MRVLMRVLMKVLMKVLTRLLNMSINESIKYEVFINITIPHSSIIPQSSIFNHFSYFLWKDSKCRDVNKCH